MNEDSPTEIATLGAGCFWCVEAIFERLEGVSDVTSGYMGGAITNPTYKAVCTGQTGHAEVVQVTFDPATISFAKLLEWFWQLLDPTTLNRQGNDVGSQYRSAIFYHSESQRDVAQKAKEAASGQFENPIVTEISPASQFWPAEEYHQDFFRLNPNQPYCNALIPPKLRKLGLD